MFYRAGARESLLAESGIGIGGFYAAKTFGNPSGGFKQGATYDGVLELHLDGDLKKWGLWKGLTRQWLSDPRAQHYCRLRPQSDDGKQSGGYTRNTVVRALASAEPVKGAAYLSGSVSSPLMATFWSVSAALTLPAHRRSECAPTMSKSLMPQKSHC